MLPTVMATPFYNGGVRQTSIGDDELEAFGLVKDLSAEYNHGNPSDKGE